MRIRARKWPFLRLMTAKIRLARLRRGCTVLRTMKAQSMVNINASCHQVVAMVGADSGVRERLEARFSCARAAIITWFQLL